MQIGRILVPEYHSSIEKELEVILLEVSRVQWRKESRSSMVDDRVFMDIGGYGEAIYRIFCVRYPVLKDRVILMKESH